MTALVVKMAQNPKDKVSWYNVQLQICTIVKVKSCMNLELSETRVNGFVLLDTAFALQVNLLRVDLTQTKLDEKKVRCLGLHIRLAVKKLIFLNQCKSF